MHKRIDILGLGCTAVDELLYVDAYPPEDGKDPVRRRERHCGGLTATAMVAGARIGVPLHVCRHPGRRRVLAIRHRSAFARRESTSRSFAAAKKRGRSAPHHHRSDRQTRTIFYDPKDVFGADPHWPHEEVIRSRAGVAGGRLRRRGDDPRGHDRPRRRGFPWSPISRLAGTRCFRKCSRLVDHLVLSRDFALKITRRTRPRGGGPRPLDVGPPGGGGHLRQRRLLVREPTSSPRVRSTSRPFRSKPSTRPAAATFFTAAMPRPWFTAGTSRLRCGLRRWPPD